MYRIDQNDMQLIVNGASFLASGGGGGVASANAVIKNILTFASEVSVISVNELTDNENLLVICGVGAPDAPDLNFLNSPADGLQGLEAMTGLTYSAVLPIEVGAMNSMIPLLACAKLGLPFIDADGAGRSVPQMSMCTYAEQHFSVEQTLIVSEKDAQYPLHPANAAVMETQVRQVVSTELHDAGTVATWSLQGKQVKAPDACVEGSLSLARNLGVAMASAQPLEEVCAIIGQHYPRYQVVMQDACVTAAENQVQGGFDVGTITLQDQTSPSLTATLYFVNESLFASICLDNIPVYYLLGPDMICCMGIDGTPMTNSEIYAQYQQGKPVHISLVWVQAVNAIRTTEMKARYIRLLLEKFPLGACLEQCQCISEVQPK